MNSRQDNVEKEALDKKSGSNEKSKKSKTKVRKINQEQQRTVSRITMSVLYMVLCIVTIPKEMTESISRYVNIGHKLDA